MMALTNMTVRLTIDDRDLQRFTLEIDRLHRAIGEAQLGIVAQPSVGAGAAVAAGLVLAGSARKRVSRRQLLTFGLLR
jgi:hypothetical protein